LVSFSVGSILWAILLDHGFEIKKINPGGQESFMPRPPPLQRKRITMYVTGYKLRSEIESPVFATLIGHIYRFNV